MKSFDTKLWIWTVGKVRELSLARTLGQYGRIESIQCLPRNELPHYYYRVDFATTDSATRALANPHSHKCDRYTLHISLSSTCSEDAEAARSELSDTGCEALIRLYLLADKLQDLITANAIVDELISLVAKTNEIPKQAPTSLAYDSTASSSPLRKLLRDYWVYQSPKPGSVALEYLKGDGFPKEFLQDVVVELMCLKMGESTSEDCKRDKCSDKCLYHQHDDEYPRCGASESLLTVSRRLWRSRIRASRHGQEYRCWNVPNTTRVVGVSGWVLRMRQIGGRRLFIELSMD